MKIVKWHCAANLLVGKDVDVINQSDGGYFVCPECEEPIYEEDYPIISINEDYEVICPVCLKPI